MVHTEEGERNEAAKQRNARQERRREKGEDKGEKEKGTGECLREEHAITECSRQVTKEKHTYLTGYFRTRCMSTSFSGWAIHFHVW